MAPAVTTSEYSPKQLSMTLTRENLRWVAEPQLPEGYVLRGYRSGDENSWADLLFMCGFEQWNSPLKIGEYLCDQERREGSRIVALGAEIVGATFASRQSSPFRAGVLDYVIIHPNHRNRGLGRAVCAGVVKFFSEHGYDLVVLQTDDWRVSAIKVYLSLGFEPEITRDDMPGRWETVMRELTLPTTNQRED